MIILIAFGYYFYASLVVAVIMLAWWVLQKMEQPSEDMRGKLKEADKSLDELRERLNNFGRE